MTISQPFVQDLLARTDVVEVVGRYVQLKKAGANFMGLCPFHGEKTPSFTVSPTKQFYHCFGCGVSGDAIKFLTQHTGMSFVEAVQDLAQRAGIAMPQDEASPAEQARERAQREQRQSLTELLDQAAKAYQKQLKLSTRAVNYLKGRGLSGEIAKTFGLGYAPDNWRPLASLLPDYGDARLVTTGLVIATEAEGAEANDQDRHSNTAREGKRYDRFRDRIMFPIRNVKGEVIGFGGRVLDKGEPKYLNSPETPLFSKGRELYGLFEARNAIRTAGYALVTEGYMDVVALAQLGFAHAVATLGTACTSEHVQKLFRFTEAVVFSFDGDAAGRRAAVKALHASLPYAQDTRSIKFLFLPPEHDPDSYIRAHGSEAFAECVRQAVPLSRFLQDTARLGCEMDTTEGRARFAAHARPLWAALPDGLLKRQLRGELAQTVGIGVHELNELWNRAGATQQDYQHPAPPPSSDAGPPASQEQWGRPAEADRVQRWRPYSSAPNPTPASLYKRPWHSSRDGAPRPPPPTTAPTPTRGALATRLLLTHPKAWQWLGADDHRLLAAQAEPLGSLLRWLESQWHEHGAQSEDELRAAMQGQAFAAEAEKLWTQTRLLTPNADAPPPASEGQVFSEHEVRRELQGLLRRMLLDDLKDRETLALQAISTHPEALETYKQLHQQRLELLQQIQNSTL